MVPYEKNPFFVERDNLLNQIFEILCDAKPHQYNHRLALYGMGGVGKTQTALSYVHLKRNYYRSIFWISGLTPFSGFQRIASVTKCALGIDDSEPFEIVKRVIE